jgi:hypothetical protein
MQPPLVNVFLPYKYRSRYLDCLVLKSYSNEPAPSIYHLINMIVSQLLSQLRKELKGIPGHALPVNLD